MSDGVAPKAWKAKDQPVGSTIRILPQQPSKPTAIETFVAGAKADSFLEAFGAIGVLLFLAASVSVVWTLWLIVLNVAPNDTANHLMGTGDFDDGNFWLIIDPDPTLTAINAMVLAILALSYVQVLVKMTIRRNSRLRITPVGPTEEEVHRQWVSNVPYVGIYLHQAAVFGVELTGYYGRYRKFWVRFCIEYLNFHLHREFSPCFFFI